MNCLLIPEKIKTNIATTWGTDYCRQYIINLLTTNEYSARFSLAQAEVLLNYLEVHDKEFPELVKPEHLIVNGSTAFVSTVK